MLLMQIVMLITVTLMFIIGVVMLTLFFINKNTVNKENNTEVVNLKLYLYVSIICFIGSIFIGVLIPLVG